MPAITVPQLLERLTEPPLALFDCRFLLEAPDACQQEYLQAHIPGAVYVHLDHDMSAPMTGRNGRHPLPEPRAIAQLFERLGISNDSDVVVYDSAGGGLAASRLWWMLRYLGHDRVSILDGGWPAWVAAGGPVRADQERRAPAEFVANLRSEMAREIDQTAAAAASSDWRVVDVRAGTRFRGDEEPIDLVAGHIPGARNRYWMDSLTPDGHLRPIDQLRAEFDALLGGVPPERSIFYCGSGVTSAFTVFVMEHAGMSGAKIFPGSWSEWSSDPARPVATGG
ncbi:MAG: sulfurtransferase [Acidobacteria bacterium]|nr:sulfurtransferase [Acidobacteriota bacterium]